MKTKNILIISLVLILGVGLFVTILNATPSKPISNNPTVISSASAKPDGAYNLSQTYSVPEGNTEKITADLVIKNGAVESINTTNTKSNRQSKQYQSNFEKSISKAVVGKKISELNLSSVGGASLTTDAFIKALNSL